MAESNPGPFVNIYEEQTWSDELPGDVADLTPPDLARSPIFKSTRRHDPSLRRTRPTCRRLA